MTIKMMMTRMTMMMIMMMMMMTMMTPYLFPPQKGETPPDTSR